MSASCSQAELPRGSCQSLQKKATQAWVTCHLTLISCVPRREGCRTGSLTHIQYIFVEDLLGASHWGNGSEHANILARENGCMCRAEPQEGWLLPNQSQASSLMEQLGRPSQERGSQSAGKGK